MLSLPTLALVVAYMASLFAIAWWYDRPKQRRQGSVLGPSLYALSLAIYCSSWTYYGAVGTGARSGWEYLPIYLGPIFAITILFPLWRKIASAAREQNVGTMADFLASRYGKSSVLGATVAIVAIIGSVPYIALQLKSLSMAGELLTADTPVAGSEKLTVLIMASALAGFAVLFGARRPDLTEHNRGLVQAIGIESLVKLGALLMVASFGMILLIKLPGVLDLRADFGPLSEAPVLNARFWAIAVVSTLALFCLPRQFHVAFVEGAAPSQVQRARWLFPLYLLLTTLAVLPIVAAGRIYAPGANPDLLVLALPLASDNRLLTAIVFVGGFSAATAMVIVETVALSAMVSNNLILPMLANQRGGHTSPGQNAAGTILAIRRFTIVSLLLLAWLYYLVIDQTSGLATMGLVSFAALAQLAPALFGAVLWRGGHSRGALTGIIVGMGVWGLTLAGPQVFHSLILPYSLVQDDGFAFGVFVSLSLNILTYILVSRQAAPRLIDRVQARAYVDRLGPEWLEGRGLSAGASVGDLQSLVARFIGQHRANQSFAVWAKEQGLKLRSNDPADASLARAAERMLAGAVGTVSARRVISAALSAGGNAPEAVLRMLDEASEAVQFNRDLLLTTLDNIDQGVVVVDEELRVTAWNRRYLEIFDLPPGFIHVGQPVEAFYRLNAERGEIGTTPEEINAWVQRRLAALSHRVPHDHERKLADGRILRSWGAPISGGSYVTSYTDITALRRAALALEEANEKLEARVADRTERLEEARRLAEDATASKTRFLAAASHDLLQPLHAARLFIAALKEEGEIARGSTAHTLATNADSAIENAHGLLTALLNLSKLEAGGVKPALAPLSLDALFTDLRREFAPFARQRRLKLTVVKSGLWVSSDHDLLRSMLQNLIGNGLRYTDQGRVLVGARRKDGQVRLQVSDTGRGIADDDQKRVFGEFVRLAGAPVDQPGAGLGLAIVQRIAALLSYPLGLQSRLGHGTSFFITLPAAARPVQTGRLQEKEPPLPLMGLRVLCVDNEPAILQGMTALLTRWGAVATTAHSLTEALTLDEPFDAAFVDLHLGDGADGLSVVRRLKDKGVRRVALVTADTREGLKEMAINAGAVLLPKPVKPAAMKAFLSG